MFMRNDDTENASDDGLEWDLDAEPALEPELEPEPAPAPSAGDLTVIEFQANVNGYKRGDQVALPHADADRWIDTGMAKRA